MAKRASGTKKVCFTVNNPKFVDFAELGYDESYVGIEWDAPWNGGWPNVSYVIFSLERGASGTLHIQGYMELTKQTRWDWLQKNCYGLATAHFEARRGSQQEAIAYCSKLMDESFICGPWEFGVKAESKLGKTKTSSTAELVQAVRSGADNRALWEEKPSLMLIYGRQVAEIRSVFKVAEPRNFKTVCFLFVGLPGTGKSRTAHILASLLGSVYKVPEARGSGLYWDGYEQQTSCIIDDMDGSRFKPAFFKQLIDRYDFSVGPLGKANVTFNSKFVFITSNSLPKSWWPKAMKSSAELKAIMRRFDCMIFFRNHLPTREAVAISELGALGPQPFAPASWSNKLSINLD